MEIDRDAPATKGDILDLRNEIVDGMRSLQADLLKAYYAFAESNLKRFAEIETESEALKSRIATLEARLLQIEKRVNFPKHPLQ
jgi:hypothetical protein